LFGGLSAAGPERRRARRANAGAAFGDAAGVACRRLDSARRARANAAMNYDIPLRTLEGDPASLADYRGKALLIVNVASKCGLTPQYSALQELQDTYEDRGFFVLGFPCNQFGAQEPGSAEEIREFCSSRYDVTFPMFEKLSVNGPDRHPLYTELTAVKDAAGKGGDIEWNFEKFLVSADGGVQRFRPKTKPEELKKAIEAALPH
jgi:glutathione peroxidase